MNINARNRDRMPFQGDNKRFTSISPNGDKLRESAKIRFTLDEPAQVHFEVTRTLGSPATIYELWANLKPGRHTFTWFPHWSMGARTYLIRLSTLDKAGNRRHLRRGQRPGGQGSLRGRPRPRRRRRLHRRELIASSAARLAIETDATELTLQTFAPAARTRAPTATRSCPRPPCRPAGDNPWKARHRRATLNRALGRGRRRLLRQADRERRPDRVRPS